MRNFVSLYINGERHQVSGEQIFQPLSNYLRYDLSLIGTKVVCAEGDCGACTVLLGTVKEKEYQNAEDRNVEPHPTGLRPIEYEVVNSCIQYVYQLDCRHIITIEGLAKSNQLHPAQQAMIDYFGSQCGYCTPGFVMAMVGMFEKHKTENAGGSPTETLPDITEQDIRDELTGNLCRCTGYHAIIESALSIDPQNVPSLSKLFPEEEIVDEFNQQASIPIAIQYQETMGDPPILKQFFNPTSITEAIELRHHHPEATLITGGTDICVQMNKDRIAPAITISLINVPELKRLEKKDGFIKIGALVSWSKLELFCREDFPEFKKILDVFASPQIKNVGTLAGNIANASPIADSLPFLYVNEGEVELASIKGRRWVKINEFYHGYKETEMRQNEIITNIRLPIPSTQSTLKLYKVSKRKDLDISTFTAGIFLEQKESMIQKIRIAYGGVGPVVLRLLKTEHFLKNKKISLKVFKDAANLSRKEIMPISDVRASSDYRFQLSENTLIKFYHEWVDEQKV